MRDSFPDTEPAQFKQDKLERKNPAAVALGKLGGASKSAKKQAASRKNGQKGGRPSRGPAPKSEQNAKTS